MEVTLNQTIQEKKPLKLKILQQQLDGKYFEDINKLPEQIESERLIIRVAKPGDGKALNDAIVESYQHLKGWVPWVHPLPSLQDSEKVCKESYDKFLLNKDLMVLFFLKNDNTLVGGSGLHSIDWKLRHFKVGYWGRSRYLNKGLTSEGVKSLINYAINDLKAKRIYLNIDAKNTRSCSFAEKIGFKLENTLYLERVDYEGKERSTCIYSFEIKE